MRSRKYRAVTTLEWVNNRLVRLARQADPRVRVKAGGTWRPGNAVILNDDDPIARSRSLPYQWDAALGRMMASAPLTIRIDHAPSAKP
jgi:hypothetical protein